MRDAVFMLLIAVAQAVPVGQRKPPLAQAMKAAQAALAGTMPPAPGLTPDGAVQLLRCALDYCNQAGTPHSEMVAAINTNNRRTAGLSEGEA